jgi:hypothetical protein
MRLLDSVLKTIFSFLLVLGLGLMPAAGQESATWKLGTAQAKITPQEPLWLAGYGGRDRPSEGTLHDLWVKALAVEATDGGRAVVVTTDLLGLPKGLADRICSELSNRCRLDRSQIMLTSSHTHCGPVLQASLSDCYPMEKFPEQPARIEAYSAGLVLKVVDTAANALAAAQPGTLWAGQGKTDFAVNRRNNPELKVEEMRQRGEALRGPVEHSVPVLAARAPDGALRAVVFGYACHNTTLSFFRWCGDYSGFAQLDLQERHPGALAMFYMGCGSDQNPLPRRTVELCQTYGSLLAGAVDEVLAKSLRPLRGRIRTAFEVLDLPFGEQPTSDKLEDMAKKKDYAARWAKRLLGDLDAGRPWAKSYPYPVQVWKLGGDQLWIVLGGEVVVDYAIRFKGHYGPQSWVTGYANDVMSYIPSHRIWEEGRYEAGAFSVYGLPAERWCEDIEDRIAACVERLVAKVK